MSKIYKSAMGKSVDMDMLRLSNEDVIAVGNMRVNARGDELGTGGKVVKSRSQAMREFHKLNTPVAIEDDEILSSAPVAPAKPAGKLAQPVAQDIPVATGSEVQANYVKPRGSFAEAVAGETQVNQELLDPPKRGTSGVKRI